jgi:Large polyvalent protein associated domain 38
MATSTEYEQWLRANQSKRGTADYATVLRAFENALQREAAQAAPAAPAAKPESGFFPALRSGATELGGGISALLGKLGLKDEATAQAEFDAAQKRSKEIFAPTEEWGLTKGLELLGGSIPYMAAPLAAGAAAAALPLTGTLAVGTALGAAGLTSAAQFTATNLSRQMEEGKKLADTDLGAAALAAVPQALLDTAAMRLVPGIGRIFGDAGIKVTAQTAKEIAEQGLKKTLIDYTAATGKTMGAEGITEAAQQVLERAQAGLSLTDPKAREEYFDSFIGGAVLGGTLAVPGRYLERSDAQGKARELLGAQEAEKRKAEREAEEAKKKSPEYLLDLEARYKAAVAKKAELDAAAAKKPPAGADPAAMIAYRDAVRERDAFAKKEMAEVSREYVNRKKEIDALNSQRSQAAELAAARDVEQPAQTLPYYESAQGTLPGFEAAEATTDEATLREQLAIAQRQGNQPAVDMLQRKLDEVTGAGDYTAQVRNLRGYVDTLRERAQAATNLEEKLRIGEEFERVQKALADATKRSKEEQQAANKEIAALQKKMAAAEAAGDIPVQVKIAKQLQALGVTDVGIQDELDLGKPQALGKLAVPTDLEDFLAAQKQKEEEQAARAAEQKRQQDLAKEAYERTQQTAGLYADIAAAEQRKAADRAAAEAEARAENERLQRQESLVEQLVQATGAVQPQPIPLARVLSPTSASSETKIDNVTELRARLAFAQQTRNKTLAADIERRLTQLGAPFEEERGSALEMGELTRAAGVEGSLTPDAMEQNRLNRLAQRQLLSYDQLVKFIEQAREREQTAVDEKTKAQYKYRAEQLKQAAIGFAIQEINGRRRQYGLPELSQKESMRAVTGLARPLNELIARGAQMFEEPVVKRAQYRGVRLIEGAQEFERPPAGKRTFSEANFNSAAATLREQFRERVEAISGKPAAPTKQAAAPTGEPRRVVPEQRALFLTPPPETETMSLAPSALLDKGIDKAASGDDARLLRQMQELYTQLTPEQQNTVREQARRAADGRPLDAVYEMRGLYQLKQQEAATAAGQTTFLKPITLVTARRKIERLAQKAAALAREAEAAKAAAIELNKNKKTQVQEAQEAFDTAREQGKDLIATAKQLRLAQTQDRLAAANKVAELEIQQRELDKQWDETVAGEFAWLQTRYQFLREEVAAGRGPKKNRAELAQLEKLYPGAADRVVRVSKALDKIKKAVAAAKKEQQELLEKQAADTATTQLLKDATEAQQRIETAQQNLIKARDDERAAERAHNVAVAAEPSPPSLLEQIEAMPLGKEGVTRVFRDTNDPAVQDQATKKRSAIAREEGVYALLEKKLQEKDVENRAELQRRLNESQARLQKLHDELYDVYNNAPLKRVQGKTVAAAVSAEQLAKARHERHVAEIDAFNAEHNTARLSLPARKVGPVVRQQGVVRQEGERVIQAEPSTPIEGIVKIRQRLAEIALQLTYIKENKAASKEGRTKQAAAKKKLGEEKTELSVKLRELLKAQRAVVSEEKAIQTELKGAKKVVKGSIRRLKLEATDAQLFEDLADANKTQEQKQLFERAENAFGVMSATEQAFVRKQANAIVGRRLDAYKGETLAEIVALAERRMARQEDVELSARGVEVETPDLSSEQVQALENNDVSQALALLSTDKTADRVHRAVAQRLAQLLDATDVEVKDTLVDEEGKPVLGQAFASGKTIRLSRAGGLSHEILLHESTHAAAERVLLLPEADLTPTQLAAKRELQALHAAVKRDPSITSTDAKGSLSEFVAEVMSNRNLQQQLAKKPWRLSDALRAFKSIVLRLLGVKDVESMLGAAIKAVDAIFLPTSVQTREALGVRQQYSQKDIAALHDGSNSMRQFAENFPQYIKQKDRTPADVDRIGEEYLVDMYMNGWDYIAPAEADKLDYKSDTIMSDGTVFDPENLLHLVEATPTTFVALKAQKDSYLRKEEASRITNERLKALKGLLQLLGVSVPRAYATRAGQQAKAASFSITNSSYTLPEKALVAKAASKYGVQSTPEGRLKLVTIDPNNRHPVAVVSKEAADAVIEELRAGKSLKAAFLDGMQRVADNNAERNKAKNGWQKFEVPGGASLSRLYTTEEVQDASEEVGYDLEGDALIEQLIDDGLLPDRRALMKTARDDAAIEKAAVELNAGAAGTSWCTGAALSTARQQIEQGDFYIYYNNGKPEVAIRMEGSDKIAEIRGNTPDQWLTPEQQKIAETFLRANSFDGSKKFIEQTQRKDALTRFFKGEDDISALPYIASTLEYDSNSFSDHRVKSLFKFNALDGYASILRPKLSDAGKKLFIERAKEALLEAAKKGRVYTDVKFGKDNITGAYKLFGKNGTVKAVDLIAADSVTTQYDIYGAKPRFVLPKLENVSRLHVFVDTELPALKTVDAVTVFKDGITLKIKKDAVVSDLQAFDSDPINFKLIGGTYVEVEPVIDYGNESDGFSVLNATIDAPYVKIIPYQGKRPNVPKAKVVTPNKISDTPPVERAGPAAEDKLLFARAQNLPTASRVASNLVGEQKGFVDKLRDNFLGMGVRTQYIDKLFPTEEALKRGGVNDKDAMQAMYYLRMYDQRMHFTSQAMTVGVPERAEKTRRDGTKEFLIEAKDGANLNQAFDILKRKDVVKEAGSADAANKLVTLYMAAIRGERVGYDTLNFGRAWASAEIARIEGELKSPKLSAEQRTNLTKRKDRLSKRLDSMPSPADIKAAKAEIDANPVLREAFNEVRDIYNQYNRDLLNFNVQTGAISRELANKLLQESDYIPYYRVRDGVAELLIGKETPIRIGNLKDSPHLQELVGGDEPVMDFITSSIQNTSMLIDMATHNLAMRNLMFEFRDVGLATIGKTKGGKAPEGAVTFKVDGVEHYGVVDTEMLGISSDLLVKGLAGIPTMFPTMIRVMGMPARFLRRLIVASPVYMARQLFRDSLGASIASGANTVPVLSALKQIGKTDVLEKRGITGGQVFTGMPEDMSRMIKDMQAGKISFNNGLAWLESKAAQADALTRRSQYESYLQQGLSEMEATYMALESMNFSRRGLSPSIHMASALIPFFNTQIQGLDVLYRSFRGKMPMNERLNVRRKLIVRGMMLFGLSFAYALAMQDDEAYKNAKPEDKYGNWFVPLDMFGIKEPLRLPIPFELGYFFKALPEAIVNIATNEKGAEEAQKALKHIGQQIVPGLSNYFIPQAVKPVLEVAFGTSLYTGRDIEPAREQGVEPGYRTQSSTTELAKAVGEMTGFSPIKLEFLIRGYTGQMGMAAIAALSAPFAGAGEGPAPADRHPVPAQGRQRHR